MSDENSELDEIDSSYLGNSELDLTDTVSNVSSSPPRLPEPSLGSSEWSRASNVVRHLYKREMGLGCSKQLLLPLRRYHLRNLFASQVLVSHVFMGMSKCGRFLLTYTMSSDQDDEEWYATVYKYRLHWWMFRPAGQARKVAEVSLFGNHKILAPLHMYVCQWPQDYEKILVYGIMRESGSDAASHNQHAFVTVTALPSVDNCQDCRVVASSYMLDDIAASWDTCLRFSCLKHGYTVHTSFDVVVPYPEFMPKISLKCHNFAVFNTNNFLYAIKIDLENCDTKVKDESEEVICDVLLEQSEETGPGTLPDGPADGALTINEKRGLKFKEQIIQDFSEEIVLNPLSLSGRSDKVQDRTIEAENAPCRFSFVEEVDGSMEEALMSPPLPTRVLSESSPIATKKTEVVSDGFRCPGTVKLPIKRSSDSKKVDLLKAMGNRDCSKPFFSKHKIPKVGLSCSAIFIKPQFKQPRAADTTYEFVEDSPHELEKLSLFRRKRLADKKYEFRDFDSENIVPFSIVRQENTLRSPRKSTDSDSLVTVDQVVCNLERKVSVEGLESTRCTSAELSVSVSSPRSPLVLEILSSPTQYMEGVLRPVNRNTSQLPSPLARSYIGSPPLSHKPSRHGVKARSCEGVLKMRNSGALSSTTLDTRLILKHGIPIHDIYERYEECFGESEKDMHDKLLRSAGKLCGRAVRFTRRFVEVDDEMMSVITDVEDDDMSAVTGYHTALNLEVHGAGYVQLQMVSNSKAERLLVPCVAVEQQSLDIEAVCHSVATTLCHASDKTFTFCNDYDIEVLDVCPRSGDVLVLLLMRIEGSEAEQTAQLKYEASVTFTWNMYCGEYKVRMVVPPQRVNWVWDDKAVWNPAREASTRFRMDLPADVTLCQPAVRVCANISTLRGISLTRIDDIENGVQFLL